ncbi:MAG: hypothetical protein KDA89_05190 [Planctomycetaceae bacterium]|nr:hypothetical protein [Planctomycetaceae bacterium]
MSGPMICLLFGSAVSAVGLIFVAFHVKSHYGRRHDNLPAVEAEFLRRQYSRRMQTSALAITLGALIGLFGRLRIVYESPLFATWYVAALLLLSVWLVMLALSDAVASRIHSNRKGRDRQHPRGTLQEALAEVRRAYGLEN